MRVVIFGATGMVGMGVLKECLDDDAVEDVLVVERRGCGEHHAKLREILHDDFFDAANQPTHMFWEVASVERNVLPAPTSTDPSDPAWIDTHVSKQYILSGFEATRITVRVRIRAVALDIIDDLIESGDLDPKYRAEIKTLTLGASVMEWTPDAPTISGDLRCVP